MLFILCEKKESLSIGQVYNGQITASFVASVKGDVCIVFQKKVDEKSSLQTGEE